MLWTEIRAAHPDQWVIVEGIDARSENGLRIVEKAEVLEVYPDGSTTVERYASLHREHPHRDLYFLHTSWDKIEIPERRWVGIRGDYPATNPG